MLVALCSEIYDFLKYFIPIVWNWTIISTECWQLVKYNHCWLACGSNMKSWCSFTSFEYDDRHLFWPNNVPHILINIYELLQNMWNTSILWYILFNRKAHTLKHILTKSKWIICIAVINGLKFSTLIYELVNMKSWIKLSMDLQLLKSMMATQETRLHIQSWNAKEMPHASE